MNFIGKKIRLLKQNRCWIKNQFLQLPSFLADSLPFGTKYRPKLAWRSILFDSLGPKRCQVYREEPFDFAYFLNTHSYRHGRFQGGVRGHAPSKAMRVCLPPPQNNAWTFQPKERRARSERTPPPAQWLFFTRKGHHFRRTATPAQQLFDQRSRFTSHVYCLTPQNGWLDPPLVIGPLHISVKRFYDASHK